MTNTTCHQQFAKQTSSAVVTPDLFLVWYPGLCSKCHSVLGSFSGIPTDLQMEHILSAPTTALRRKRDVSVKKKETLEMLNNDGIACGQRQFLWFSLINYSAVEKLFYFEWLYANQSLNYTTFYLTTKSYYKNCFSWERCENDTSDTKSTLTILSCNRKTLTNKMQQTPKLNCEKELNF